MHTVRIALTSLTEPSTTVPGDDYGHGLEDAKAAVREALTDHPDPEHSLREWTTHLPPWEGHGHQAGYWHIQYEAARILAGDPDTVADYLTTGDECP